MLPGSDVRISKYYDANQFNTIDKTEETWETKKTTEKHRAIKIGFYIEKHNLKQ